MRAGGAQRDGPGGGVAVGVAGVGEDVAQGYAVAGHAGQDGALNRLVLGGFVADLGKLHGPLAKAAGRMRADGSCL